MIIAARTLRLLRGGRTLLVDLEGVCGVVPITVPVGGVLRFVIEHQVLVLTLVIWIFTR